MRRGEGKLRPPFLKFLDPPLGRGRDRDKEKEQYDPLDNSSMLAGLTIIKITMHRKCHDSPVR